MAAFGKEIMKKEFVLDSKHTFLNHGSYGSVPRRVNEYRMRLLVEMEEHPDAWFRWKSTSLWDENIKDVCSFFHSHVDNLVFVNNTTTGVNTVVHSLPLQKGDAILIDSWAFFAFKNLAEYLARVKDLEALYVDHPNQLESPEQILDAYEQMLSTHSNIKLVIIDYIVCVPPVLMPIAQLISLCRRYNTFVLVDGAHVPGQLDVNLEELGADFFVGSLHKWAFTPRGCAVLWVRRAYHHMVFPLVTLYIDYTVMSKNFAHQGSMDCTSYYSTNQSLQFFRDIGGHEAIYSYCSDLVQRGSDLLVKLWGTKSFQIPESMISPFMRFVRVPDLVKYSEVTADQCTTNRVGAPMGLRALTNVVWERFKVQSLFFLLDDEPWCRISASVYNELCDFELLGNAILKLQNEN